MTFEEAIGLLDEPTSTNICGDTYAWSPSRFKQIVKGPKGLCNCTGDSPIPENPNEEDRAATDWVIRHFKN